MTQMGSSGEAVSARPGVAAFPDGTELRRWARRRTRRHRRGVWALVGDIYSGLLTIVVVGTILVPHLSRLVAARPSSSSQEVTGLGALDLDPGWLVLALTMMLLALGIGPLSRLGPLFLRPHEAAWWLPMPGDRGTLLVPVARVEYLITVTAGAVMGVLPALASAGGWGAAVAWSVLIAAGTCLVLSELITAQVQGRGVTRLRRFLILLGAAACLAGTTFPFPRSMTGNMVVATLAVAEPARQAWFDGAPDASWPVSPWLVRVGHLLVPGLFMSTWSLLSLAPAMTSLGAAGAWKALGVVAALALVSGWAWAGAALRSGFRAMPDFAAGLVTSPVGSLPPGLVQMLVEGPDAALVGALATALVACGIVVPTTTVLGIQAAAGAVVILWGVRTNRRAS